MTTQGDLDRVLSSYFGGRSLRQAPDGLLEAALAGVASTRQRPRAFVAAGWGPVRRAGAGLRVVAVVAVIMALIAVATALLLIGSQPRLPPPFGLARPGLIAFDAGGDVYAARLDGAEPVRIISGPRTENQATYSPDGSLIAFERGQPDLTITLFVMAADGGSATPVIDGIGASGSIAWSPDSRGIAVATMPPGSDDGFRILVARIGQPGVARLGGPDVFGIDPAWSPDGTRIAFTREWPCCGGEPDAIWLARTDGTDLHALTPDLPTSRIAGAWATGGGRAAWSPDGRHIAFMAPTPHGSNAVFVVGVDGGDPVDVSNSPQDVTGFSWSPDGSRLAYTRMQGQYGYQSEMVLVDADGTHPRRLDGPSLSGDAPIWSPDGTRVLGLAWSSPDMVEGHGTGKDEIVAFDPSGRVAPTVISLPRFNNVSWQRLAP